MRTVFQISLLVGLFILLVACAQHPQEAVSSPPPSPTSISTRTSLPAALTPSASPTDTPAELAELPTKTPAPTPSDSPLSAAHYQIDAALDYASHHLSVEQQITYTNPYSEPLPDLLLVVEPSRYPATFTLKELRWQSDQPIQNYSRDIGRILIPLESALPPGETVEISIAYNLDIPSPSPSLYGRPVPFGYSSRQTNLVDWYPFIPPYQPGFGWVAHQAGAFGEHLVYDVADFDVNVQILDSNPDLVIAASAPGAQEDDVWQYHLDNARNFAWSVSDQYVLSTTTVDSILVLSYYFPLDADAGEAVLVTTAESVDLYNDLFGPYPRQVLTVVEADFLDGMEYEGLYFLSKGFYGLYSGDPADYLTAIAAHETAHQWWYSMVANDQALEPWLDEALSTYSEKLYYEHMHPNALDWWWTYRINYYDPQGWVDGSIYNPLGYRAYRDAVYLNGALFFDDLRTLIGEQPFFDFLKQYLQDYHLDISTGDDFFAVLDQFTQADLQPLLDKYFENR